MKLNIKWLAILLSVTVLIVIAWFYWPYSSRVENLDRLGFNRKAGQSEWGEGPLLVISVSTEDLRATQNLRRYQYLELAIEELPSVQRVVTLLDTWRSLHPSTADSTSRFLTIPEDSVQLDRLLYQPSLYEKGLTNAEQTVTFMVIVFQEEMLNVQRKKQLLDDIKMLSEQFSQVTGIPLRYGATDALQGLVISGYSPLVLATLL